MQAQLYRWKSDKNSLFKSAIILPNDSRHTHQQSSFTARHQPERCRPADGGKA